MGAEGPSRREGANLVLMRSMGDMTMAVTSPAVMDDTKWHAVPSCMTPDLRSMYLVWS